MKTLLLLWRPLLLHTPKQKLLQLLPLQPKHKCTRRWLLHVLLQGLPTPFFSLTKQEEQEEAGLIARGGDEIVGEVVNDVGVGDVGESKAV